MNNNPDTYLLYEYMEKVPFTVRYKFELDSLVDAALLKSAANEAIKRFPYFSVKVGLDEGQNYTLEHNDEPLAVIPEKDKKLVLGSEEVNGHLAAITYKDDCIWFNISHSLCGAVGALFWIKATLYLYTTKQYGDIESPVDIKLPGTPVPDEEIAFPDAEKLPDDEPIARYMAGHCNIALGRFLKHLLNPFAKDNYFYQIEIPANDFMDYVHKIDGTPNTVLTAMMYKVITGIIKEKKNTFIGARISADYRKDIGAASSYRDFVRFVHIKYDWSLRDAPISKLNLIARGEIIKQNQPELSYERFKNLNKAHKGIDSQPDLKSKKKYASKNSTFRSDPRAAYVISYVGKVDWGSMDKHFKGVYTITDGDLMFELNATRDNFYLTFQLIDKDRKPLDTFCKVLESEGIPYKVSDRYTRYMPAIKLPR